MITESAVTLYRSFLFSNFIISARVLIITRNYHGQTHYYHHNSNKSYQQHSLLFCHFVLFTLQMKLIICKNVQTFTDNYEKH